MSYQEFVIHTPCENAQKMYIGNALKGHYAAVFAQLMIDRECHGMYDQKGASHVVDIGIFSFHNVLSV